MTLRADATAVLHSEHGENWTENYPSPVKQLAEKDGLILLSGICVRCAV